MVKSECNQNNCVENVNTSDIKSNRKSLQDKKKMKVDTKAKKGGDVGTSTTDEVLRKTKEDLGMKKVCHSHLNSYQEVYG